MTTGVATTPESPRENYAAACAEIAAHFSDREYRFAKSGPHATRKSGDFTYQIGFQSSHKNVAGVSVKLWIHGTVFSKRLETWRSSHPQLRAIDYVAGGQIGNLTDDTIWHDWNLADPITRQSTIETAISTIELVAMPYFAQFDDLSVFIPKLQHSDVPSMTIDRVIEFLMCFADHHAARTAAVNFLQRRPDLARSYTRDFQRYADRGLDWSHPSGYAKQLAFASHMFDFGDLTQNGA
jgi:hypothetical protein